MNEALNEADIQWLAQILAMIPVPAMPADTLVRLQAHELITERPGGWAATDKGVQTIISWK